MPLAHQHKKKMGVDVISHISNMPQDFYMASILLIETLVFGLYLMSDLVFLSEYDFDQDTFIALWNNCTFEEDHRKHHTRDCLGLEL